MMYAVRVRYSRWIIFTIFPVGYRKKSPENPRFINFQRLHNLLLASPVFLLFFKLQTDQFRSKNTGFYRKLIEISSELVRLGSKQ